MSNLFDTSTAPTCEPKQIAAGDYVAWKRTDLSVDYPNTEYQLKYRGRRAVAGNASEVIEIDAAADGVDYLVELLSATTAEYIVGEYYVDVFIERISDSQRARIAELRWSVTANKSEDASDPRSHNKKVLDAIEAAIEGRADNKQLDILSANLDVDITEQRDTSMLLRHRATYRGYVREEIRRKLRQQGKDDGTTIRSRM